jgi:hypothetical protein
MSLLHSVVFRSVCRCTHHRLALDALRFLRGADADGWSDLVVHNHGEYLRGSTAPDEQFRDFRNHVWHVGERAFGNAPHESRRWYGRTVDSLRRREWSEAVWNAGVLSHYFSDPFLPLNTAQCEEQTQIQRAVEWCVGGSYGELQQILERDQGGYPQLEAPQSADWLERMVQAGAELAHEHHQTVLDHFDLGRAVRDPLAGMDAECRDRLATCLGHAVVGFARVLERAIAEAEVEPPPVETTLQGFGIGLAQPLRWLARQVEGASERLAVEAAYDEVQRSGKVLKNLTAEQREVRRLYAEEVLKVSLHQLDHQPAGLTGTLHRCSADEPRYANRLMTSPPLRIPPRASSAWGDARRRVQQQPPRPLPAGLPHARAA